MLRHRLTVTYGLGPPASLPRRIQPKLKISHPGDTYEQEADRIAEEVVPSIETSSSQAHSGEAERSSGITIHSGDVSSLTATQKLQRNCSGCEGGAPCAECGEEEKGSAVMQAKSSPENSGPRESVSDNFLEDLGQVFPWTNPLASLWNHVLVVISVE